VAKVGLSELRSGDMKSRFDQAVMIANSLSGLKGAAMKAGQLLSLDLDNYFPPEAIEILSQLQNAAVAHPFSEIETVLNNELSSETKRLLTSISPLPIGVASIAQVHKAKHNGHDVVLKVQYPGVGDSIDSDLKILKTVAVSFCQLTGRKMNLDPLFQEFRTILTQEVNYLIEADFQKQYKESISRLNASSIYQYRVPQVIDELSTQHLLTMEFEKGVSLRSWIASKPNPEDRNELASAVLNLYFHEFFQWGLVQTDPNWGNFLVDTKDSKLTLVLLDFGATRKYTPEFIKNYILLLNLAADKNSAALKQHAIQFGLIDSRESAAAFKALEVMLSTAIKPFFTKNSGKTTFDFADRNHTLDSQNAAKMLTDELVYSAPPYQLMFLHRKLAGVYSILKSLEVKLDISSYWQKMTDLAEGNH
tara:strand:+ start:12047 stop:13306 length:1260 start_codon:yes stop_codon:yes gene_type:complete